jgi:tRNA threonylcarbamoyladenosine biosynthesis protein TsaB
MIVLGIDTSGYANAVGVVNGESVLADLVYEAKTDSLEKIFTNIDDALHKAGLALRDMDGIGVGLGPGSWTGIRVGVTVAKMLAFSTNKPVAGVPTLEALAYGLHRYSRPVWAVISVGTGDAVYAAGYRLENDAVSRVGDYYVGDVKGFAALITEPAIIVGVESPSYARIVTQASGIEVGSVKAGSLGVSVASLARQRLVRGEPDDVLSLTPLYLKESTAKAFINKYKVATFKGREYSHVDFRY